MDRIKVQLNNEKETLLPTLYGKAMDSAAAQPILGDRYAAEVVRHIDYDWAKLALPKNAAVTLPMRAKHLDDWTREFLRQNANATVLHLGCGLDSRVFRVDPPAGVRWYDVDQPEVIELRKRLYPERHDYRLIATSVTEPGWLDELPHSPAVLVVAEGLVQYLTEDAGLSLFRRITEKYPKGELIFDAYSKRMNWLVGRLPVLKDRDIHLSWGIDDPRLLERRIPGLALVADVPFLTMPELVSRLARSRLQRALYGLLGRTAFLRHAVRHLRYRFPATYEAGAAGAAPAASPASDP